MLLNANIKKNVSRFPQKYLAAQPFSTLIDNSEMNSEGSSDTEDWSNDAETSALHHRNK